LEKLKPCPFCGGKAYIAQNYLGQKYVCCPECGACVWGGDTDDWRIATMGEKKAEKAAIEAWNNRAVDIDMVNGKEPADTDIPIFDKETRIENCTVQILENTKTGRVSIGWWRNE